MVAERIKNDKQSLADPEREVKVLLYSAGTIILLLMVLLPWAFSRENLYLSVVPIVCIGAIMVFFIGKIVPYSILRVTGVVGLTLLAFIPVGLIAFIIYLSFNGN